MKKRFDPIIPVVNDGLVIPEVGIWSLEKYQLVGGYCDIFTKGMRNKWNNLVYIDLFSGAGYAKIRETGNIIKSSSLISLSVPIQFDKYIFCEENSDLEYALSQRVSKEVEGSKTKIFCGDCNNLIDEIKSEIPKYSKGNTVLAFCFVDPFHMNIKFDTIKSLANDLTDFLILQALHMDANRNFNRYIEENNSKIEEYLGDKYWREEWKSLKMLPSDFVRYLADKYDRKMKEMEYLTAMRHAIRFPDKNVPLYYLTFYSKHERGLDFFKKVDDYSTDQLRLGI